MTTSVASPATDRQIAFLTKLFTDAQAKHAAAVEAGKGEQAEALSAALAAHQGALVAVVGGQPADKRQVSSAIDALLGVGKALDALTAPVFAGLAGAQRVITNRYAKPCSWCGVAVDAEAGHAALYGAHEWRTACVPCATEAPAVRQERLQAAQKAAEGQEKDRLVAASTQAREIKVLADDLFARLGTEVNQLPKALVAIPSATGNNDLDFFKVQTAMQSRRPYVLRVIGGHDDQRLSADQAHAALVRLACVEDVQAAAETYGRELGFCGCCGRHLTDEVSRQRGIGPDCARKYF